MSFLSMLLPPSLRSRTSNPSDREVVGRADTTPADRVAAPAPTACGRSVPAMTRAGDLFENAVTRERVLVRVGGEDTSGRYLAVDAWVGPHAIANEHVHPHVRGARDRARGVGPRQGRRRRARRAPRRGRRRPAGTVHDYWNPGDEEARVLVEVWPAARFEEMMVTLFGLAQEGRVSARGLPSLLQLAVLAREFDDVVLFSSPAFGPARGDRAACAGRAAVRCPGDLRPPRPAHAPPRAGRRARDAARGLTGATAREARASRPHGARDRRGPRDRAGHRAAAGSPRLRGRPGRSRPRARRPRGRRARPARVGAERGRR